jgi:hypothetical protein
MRLLVINILLFTAICLTKVSFGQHDSSLLVLSELPSKYFKEVDKKRKALERLFAGDPSLAQRCGLAG